MSIWNTASLRLVGVENFSCQLRGVVDSIDPKEKRQVAVIWHNFADTRGTSNAVVSWVCSQVIGCIPYAAAELELESWLGK